MSPASKPFEIFTFAVEQHSAIVLVLKPATASSTYYFIATSEFEEGLPIPVIEPPEIDTEFAP